MTVVHPHRKLARKIIGATRTGTPMRHLRGVIVSSTIGQSQVTFDGGATSVPAFNYGHTVSLPAGTVVDALAVGKKMFVYGAYGTVAGSIIKESVLSVAGVVASLAGPQTNHGWTSVTVTKLRPETVLNVQFQGSMWISGTVSASPIVVTCQANTTGYGTVCQFLFNVLSDHASFGGTFFNLGAAGGGIVGATGSVVVNIALTIPTGVTWHTDTTDWLTLTVREVEPG